MGDTGNIPGALYSSAARAARFVKGVTGKTAIELRWPFVIGCSYWILYSPTGWLTPTQTYAFLICYLLLHATLYFVAYPTLNSGYFSGPLPWLDGALLTLAMISKGASTADFYLACFVTLILSYAATDRRGLVVITLIAPALCGYLILQTGKAADPNLHWRLSLPFLIALGYGYFAHIDRLRRLAYDREEQMRRQRNSADEIRRQRERLKFFPDVNAAVTSAQSTMKLVDVLSQKILARVPYSGALIRLRNAATGEIETCGSSRVEFDQSDETDAFYALVDRVAVLQQPLVIRDVLSDPNVSDCEMLQRRGVASMVILPLAYGEETIGTLTFVAAQKTELPEEELEFLSIFSQHAAIVIDHSRLFQQVQRQAAELRNANKVKDEFLGIVSHELRTPLNVISGYTNMLREGALGEITPIQEKALETILRQTRDLQSTISSVLQVSCIEAELVQVELHETNFREFLYDVKSHYDYPLGKDVRVVWQFSPDLPTMMADRGKLRQILYNIINNAIKFTHQGNVIISAQYLRAKKCMEFKVADEGIGIPPDEVPRIFEKFHQADSSDSRSYFGIGLGLYIAKKCADILGATIQVESKPGKGSTFMLRVPCSARKPETTALPPLAATG